VEPSIDSLDHLVLTVANLKRTISFYSNCLGMTPEQFDASDGSTRWALRFGFQKINLHLAGKEFEPKARQSTPGAADICFLSSVPITHWKVHLNMNRVPIELGPVRRSGATGPILSIYLRDPDGNLIEIANRI